MYRLSVGMEDGKHVLGMHCTQLFHADVGKVSLEAPSPLLRRASTIRLVCEDHPIGV